MIPCRDAKQKVVGALDQQMRLGLDEAHYRQAMTEGLPLRRAVVPVNGDVTRVKVLVYDYASDRLGAVNVLLK